VGVSLGILLALRIAEYRRPVYPLEALGTVPKVRFETL
jgi:hypothetical protein